MPELPEVETIKLGLSKKLPGLKIKSVEVLNLKSFQPFDSFDDTQDKSAQSLRGKKILSVFRRAKILGINLENNLTLLIHLKMSGQLILQGDRSQAIGSEAQARRGTGDRLIGGHPTQDMVDEMPNRSTRVILHLTRDDKRATKYTLFFNDQRKFGWIKLINSDQLTDNNYFKNLGPEPLEKDFTLKIFKERLQKRKSLPIKVAIMDQQIISGVGNIYASEACFNAKLDPRIKVKDLTDQQYKMLHQGVIKALKDGVKYGGSTRTHFVSDEGKKGYFLDYAYVYWKNGQQCKKCKTIIEKITLAGRGTYFCPTCQA